MTTLEAARIELDEVDRQLALLQNRKARIMQVLDLLSDEDPKPGDNKPASGNLMEAILTFLGSEPAATAEKIASALQISPGITRRSCNRLVKNGLLALDEDGTYDLTGQK